MTPEIRSILAGTAGLSLLLGVAGIVSLGRPNLATDRRTRARLSLFAMLAIAAQGVHFAEELHAGFHARFPAQFGLPPWSPGFFIIFNATWLLVWSLAVAGARAGMAFALWPLWFLALALVVNALAHPLLALRVGGYFPGLITAPLCAAAGVMLLRQLALSTAPRHEHVSTA